MAAACEVSSEVLIPGKGNPNNDPDVGILKEGTGFFSEDLSLRSIVAVTRSLTTRGVPED
jgi:hypothetical protein